MERPEGRTLFLHFCWNQDHQKSRALAGAGAADAMAYAPAAVVSMWTIPSTTFKVVSASVKGLRLF